MRPTMVLLLVAAALFGQDAALVSLKREAALVKASAKDESKEPSVTALHRALREWIESRLPLETYFLVRELGNYRYEMEAVSDSRPTGCPGEQIASEKHPWLTPAELKALR